jgi:hypothetical protein
LSVLGFDHRYRVRRFAEAIGDRLALDHDLGDGLTVPVGRNGCCRAGRLGWLRGLRRQG